MQSKSETFRDADQPFPKAISLQGLKAFFDDYNFNEAAREKVSSSLQQIITGYAKHMRSVREGRSHSDDRENLKVIAKLLSEARKQMESLGPLGKRMVREESTVIGNVISAGWVHDTFFGEALVPDRQVYGRPAGTRPGPRDEMVYVEEHTIDARRGAARNKSTQLMAALLAELEDVLHKTVSANRKKGGRNPTPLRTDFIINLAKCLQDAGFDPLDRNSRSIRASEIMIQFSAEIFEQINWSNQGLVSAAHKAVAEYSRIRP